jgi:hypothetical protein
MVIDAAVEHGDLSTEQETAVQAIRERWELAREDKRETRQRLRASAAEIVRSGTAHSEEFDQALAEATAAIERRVAVSSDAIKDVHSLLDADQRVAVADALRARVAERAQKRREREERDGFRKVATHLMLDALQVDKLKLLREQLMGESKRLRPSEEEINGLIDAFETDEFDAALDAFNAEKLGLIRERMATAADHADTVLSIFDDNQRALLGELIEKGPKAVGLERDDSR